MNILASVEDVGCSIWRLQPRRGSGTGAVMAITKVRF